MFSNQTAKTEESLFHSRSFTWKHTWKHLYCHNLVTALDICHNDHLLSIFAYLYLGLVLVEREGEVSVEQSVLFHEHHTVFVVMTPRARYQTARRSETPQWFK